MQWTIAQIQKLLGEQIATVRVSVFLIGISTLIFFTLLIHHLFEDWYVAIFSSILLQYSPVFYYYTINPIPDNMAFSFGMAYIYYIVKHRHGKKSAHLILAGIFLGLSSLCKLQYLMLSVVSITYFINDILRGEGKIKSGLIKYAIPQLILILPTLVWYTWVIKGWSGNPILTGKLNEPFNFNEYKEIFNFHCKTMFPNFLASKPIWIFLIIGIVEFYRNQKQKLWQYSLIMITFIFLFFEFRPIGKVHDYYLMPFLYWIYVILAYGLDFVLKLRFGLLIVICISIISSFHTSIESKYKWTMEETFLNKDVFIHSEELKNVVSHQERCIILNDPSRYVFSYRIDKMGYIFHSDHLPIGWVNDLVVNHNVKFMYSDSRKVDETEEFQQYIDSLLLQKGSIKVFKLKRPDDNTR